MTFGNFSFSNTSNTGTGGAGMPQFEQPASGDSFDLKANEGALLLVRPTDFREDIQTAYGSSSAVQADVVVLDGPNEGDTVDDALIFPKVLQGNLKKYIGKNQWCLGRLGKGQAKPGQSAPWVLAPFTEEDAKVAQKWVSTNPDF